jgi:hypothetical protein
MKFNQKRYNIFAYYRLGINECNEIPLKYFGHGTWRTDRHDIPHLIGFFGIINNKEFVLICEFRLNNFQDFISYLQHNTQHILYKCQWVGGSFAVCSKKQTEQKLIFSYRNYELMKVETNHTHGSLWAEDFHDKFFGKSFVETNLRMNVRMKETKGTSLINTIQIRIYYEPHCCVWGTIFRLVFMFIFTTYHSI